MAGVSGGAERVAQSGPVVHSTPLPAMPAVDTVNPCLDCGACCASFRVSFYWAEADARGIPIELTEQVNQRFSCMAGTHCANPRCTALDGEVGHKVGCRIYAQRPEPCREVQAGDAQCARARAKHGMGAVGA